MTNTTNTPPQSPSSSNNPLPPPPTTTANTTIPQPPPTSSSPSISTTTTTCSSSHLLTLPVNAFEKSYRSCILRPLQNTNNTSNNNNTPPSSIHSLLHPLLLALHSHATSSTSPPSSPTQKFSDTLAEESFRHNLLPTTIRTILSRVVVVAQQQQQQQQHGTVPNKQSQDDDVRWRYGVMIDDAVRILNDFVVLSCVLLDLGVVVDVVVEKEGERRKETRRRRREEEEEEEEEEGDENPNGTKMTNVLDYLGNDWWEALTRVLGDGFYDDFLISEDCDGAVETSGGERSGGVGGSSSGGWDRYRRGGGKGSRDRGGVLPGFYHHYGHESSPPSTSDDTTTPIPPPSPSPPPLFPPPSPQNMSHSLHLDPWITTPLHQLSSTSGISRHLLLVIRTFLRYNGWQSIIKLFHNNNGGQQSSSSSHSQLIPSLSCLLHLLHGLRSIHSILSLPRTLIPPSSTLTQLLSQFSHSLVVYLRHSIPLSSLPTSTDNSTLQQHRRQWLETLDFLSFPQKLSCLWRLLSSDTLPLRLLGLNEIRMVIEDVTTTSTSTTSTTKSSPHPSSDTRTLLEFLTRKNILTTYLTPSHLHPELLKRLLPLVLFFQSQNAFSLSDVRILAHAALLTQKQQHESIRNAIFDLLSRVLDVCDGEKLRLIESLLLENGNWDGRGLGLLGRLASVGLGGMSSRGNCSLGLELLWMLCRDDDDGLLEGKEWHDFAMGHLLGLLPQFLPQSVNGGIDERWERRWGGERTEGESVRRVLERSRDYLLRSALEGMTTSVVVVAKRPQRKKRMMTSVPCHLV